MARTAERRRGPAADEHRVAGSHRAALRRPAQPPTGAAEKVPDRLPEVLGRTVRSEKRGGKEAQPAPPPGLLGKRVLRRASRLGPREGGLQFPAARASLCAARLRSPAANAAIKACFAPALMLGSVVEWPHGRSWSWGPGRGRLPPHPFLLLQLPRGHPRVFPLGAAGWVRGSEQLERSRGPGKAGLASLCLASPPPQGARPLGLVVRSRRGRAGGMG